MHNVSRLVVAAAVALVRALPLSVGELALEELAATANRASTMKPTTAVAELTRTGSRMAAWSAAKNAATLVVMLGFAA